MLFIFKYTFLLEFIGIVSFLSFFIKE